MKNASNAADPIDAPRLVQDLIAKAEKAGASDVHLQMTSGGADISFRLDGVMTPISRIPPEVAERVFGRIKYLARLKTYQDSLPQDGRIDRHEGGASQDIRVATYPTVSGEKIVLRLFTSGDLVKLDELGLPEPATKALDRFLHDHTGLLLLTGPAGSGKTTTIYACLRRLVEIGGRHIITIEDPVEQTIPGIMQTEVNEGMGLTFSKAARHLLRQDPQVLVIGEIRDDETANIALRASLTGHLVISTLHAGSCRGVIERLLTMCPDHYAVFSTLRLILNQRLVRKKCSSCGGEGCEACLGTGCRGRIPLLEWVELNEDDRAKLRSSGAGAIQPVQSIQEAARALLDSGKIAKIEFDRVCPG